MEKNLTRGFPAKLILGFAFPLLIGNLFQQIYGVINTLIVGRFLGVEALAAVGCTGGILFFIIGFIQAMASGFAIVTAQAYGARQKQGVRNSFCISLTLGAMVSVALTLAATFFAHDILELLDTPAAILEPAHSYIIVIYRGIPATILFNLLSSSILALGDSRPPLLFLMIACIINILLDFLFILGFGWGVSGASTATVLAQLTASALCLVYIMRRVPALRLRRKDWVMSAASLWRSARIGLPMGFQASTVAIGAIILQWALNGLGKNPVAAFTVARTIDMVAILPMASFGLAMATYVGQNYGAGAIDRIRQGVRHCCAISLLFSVMVGLMNIFGGTHLIGFFVGEGQEEVTRLAQTFLTINASMYWVLALLFIFRFSLQGLGKSLVPTLAGFVELAMRGGAAVMLTQSYGFIGACVSNPLAWVGACIPLAAAYMYTIRKLSGAPG